MDLSQIFTVASLTSVFQKVCYAIRFDVLSKIDFEFFIKPGLVSFQGFIDNGYDDFETVKRMGGEDLLAVGVTDLQHQTFILEAVRVLREKGAVWVYLLDTGLSASMSDSLHAEYNNCQQPKSSDLEGAAR